MMKKVIAAAALFLGLSFLALGQNGTWSGKLDVQGVQLPIVFHLNEENPTMDSPSQSVRGVPIEVERTVEGSVKIRIPSIGATFEGQWLIRQIVGTFKQMGASLPLTLMPGEEKLNRPQTPQGPFPYAQEEVAFTNGDAVLKGTLVLPEGCSRKTPVLIMVTGSGLQNRDEELFEHKPFAVVADALARAGIATLRYDDRGFGESSGDIVGCTTEDLKNDALAGIRLLRERFDRVGVIGHSEGGTIALLLAAEGQADFIVSLAGMVVSGAETLLWQNRIVLPAAGFTEEDTDKYCRALADVFDAIMAGKQMPSAEGYHLPAALEQNLAASVLQSQTPYMKHFLGMDVRPVLGRVSCPVLALNGTKDVQVECESNLGALRDGLPGHPKNRIEAVEEVNHLFQHCRTGMPQEYRDIEETIAPAVLEAMVNWILTL